MSELPREGGFPRALEPRHQDDGRCPFEVDFGGLAPHELSQLIVDDLYHQFAWAHSGKYVLS